MEFSLYLTNISSNLDFDLRLTFTSKVNFIGIQPRLSQIGQFIHLTLTLTQ